MITFYRDSHKISEIDIPLHQAKAALEILNINHPGRWSISAQFKAKNACTFVFGKKSKS